MPTIKITQELLDQLAPLAAAELRSIEMQAAWLIREGLKRQEDKDRANQRQKRKRGKAEESMSRDSHVTVTLQSRVSHVTSPPSSPSLSPPLSSPTPPSNPSAHPPSPTPTHIHAREDQADEVPFAAPLEPLRPDEEPELKLTTSALQRPATPAPKPSKRKLVGEDDPRFAEFRQLYASSGGPRCKEWSNALTIWRREDLSAPDRFPLVMAALQQDLQSRDWKRADQDGTPNGYVPLPATWLGKRRWKDVTLAMVPVAVQATTQSPDDRLYALVTKGYSPGDWSEAGWLLRTIKLVTADTGAQLDRAALETQLQAEGFRAVMLAIARAGQAAYLASQKAAHA